MEMKRSRDLAAALAVVFVVFWSARALAGAQEHVGQYSQVDVETGFNLYNSNCITCHGANGDSVAGVNLRSGQFRRASSDSDLNRLIQTGIPGTAMPPGRYSTAELAGLVAY
jgi:mono/diheme cytochrome c family protein